MISVCQGFVSILLCIHINFVSTLPISTKNKVIPKPDQAGLWKHNLGIGQLLANLFLNYYEAKFLRKLLSNNKKRLTSNINSTLRYIDDVLSINNNQLSNYISVIYPVELEIKDTYESGILREGDILEVPKNRHAVANHQLTWTGRNIPYVIDPNFSEDERNAIVKAIYELHDKIGTECINFRDKEDEDIDYVAIVKSKDNSSCNSYVGRIGGSQTLSLAPSCLNTGTIFHELLHTLGFWHEHTRPDRNQYINVLWDNIEDGAEVYFHKMSKWEVVLLADYDYYSIMHFSLEAYQKEENLTTMEPLDVSVDPDWIGQRYNLTSTDIYKIRKLYKCGVQECLPPGTLQSGVITTRRSARFSVGSTVTYKCNAGFTLIGPVTRQCTDNSTWTGDTPVCMDQTKGIYHYCNFDEPTKCGWKTSWKWTNYPTQLENTGPTWDHTFESSMGSYVYADGEVLMEKGNLTLVSPTFVHIPNIDYCLTFTYSMHGDGMGSLEASTNACGAIQVLKTWSGNQGQYWNRANIPVHFPCNLETFNIIFNAESGSTFESDIAIDDILLADCTTVNQFLTDQEHNAKSTGDYALPWPT